MFELNEADGYIVGQYWLSFAWEDYYLKWDPEDFGGIAQIHIPVAAIWQPDIALYNDARGENMGFVNPRSTVSVRSSGHVMYLPYVELKSTCTFDMHWFPFDTHTCSLQFGSWAYTMSKMFIVPGVVSAVVVPFIFALPTMGPHRYVLGASLAIATAVTLTGFDMVLPTANSTPVIVRWYTSLQCLLYLALVLSVVITNLAIKSTRGEHPPAIVKKVVVDGLGRLLRVTRATTEHKFEDEQSLAGSPGKTEWYQVALVADRACFIAYFTVFLILAITCAL